MSWQSRRYFVTVEISRKDRNVARAMGHTRGNHQQPGTVRGLYWRVAIELDTEGCVDDIRVEMEERSS